MACRLCKENSRATCIGLSTVCSRDNSGCRFNVTEAGALAGKCKDSINLKNPVEAVVIELSSAASLGGLH